MEMESLCFYPCVCSIIVYSLQFPFCRAKTGWIWFTLVQLTAKGQYPFFRSWKVWISFSAEPWKWVSVVVGRKSTIKCLLVSKLLLDKEKTLRRFLSNKPILLSEKQWLEKVVHLSLRGYTPLAALLKNASFPPELHLCFDNRHFLRFTESLLIHILTFLEHFWITRKNIGLLHIKNPIFRMCTHPILLQVYISSASPVMIRKSQVNFFRGKRLEILRVRQENVWWQVINPGSSYIYVL